MKYKNIMLSVLLVLTGFQVTGRESIPIVIPTPQKLTVTGQPFNVYNIHYVKNSNEALNEAIEGFSETSGVTFNNKSKNMNLLINSASNDLVRKALKRLNLLEDYKKQKNDGYVLIVEKHQVVIASKTDVGQFYGFTSFVQLFKNKLLTPVTIIDQPGYEQRGIVFGKLLNFYRGPFNRDTRKFDGSTTPYLEYMKKYKLNFIWLAKWDNSFYDRISLPIQPNSKKVIKDFLIDCKKYFITPSLGLRPYKQKPYLGREKGGVMYSSQKDINAVANNLITLYDLGVVNLFLTFDDQPKHTYLIYKEDKKKFNHVAEAHFYFVNEVYKIVKAKCPKAKFRFIAIPYSIREEKYDKIDLSYCKIISKLPKEIEFVWTGGGKTADAQWYSKTTGGRKLIYWSNFFPIQYEKQKYTPVFIKHAYGEGDADLPKYSTGHFFLPQGDDAAGIGWMTASDYMWNPKKYDRNRSLKRAIATVTGTSQNAEIIDYMNLVEGIYKEKGIPGWTTDEKLSKIKHLQSVMTSSVQSLKGKVDEKLYGKLLKEKSRIASYLKFLTTLFKSRPAPLKAARMKSKINIDGNLSEPAWKKADIANNFLYLGSKKHAQLKTKARFTYDDENLYIGVWVEEPEMHKIKDKFLENDSEIYRDSGIEFFLYPEKSNIYYQIVTNMSGFVYDKEFTQLKNGSRIHNKKWNVDYKLKIRKEKKSWTLEIAIPWKNLKSSPDKRFTFNITRNRYIGKPKTRWQTYSPLLASRFHLVQWFWPLTFNK